MKKYTEEEILKLIKDNPLLWKKRCIETANEALAKGKIENKKQALEIVELMTSSSAEKLIKLLGKIIKRQDKP